MKGVHTTTINAEAKVRVYLVDDSDWIAARSESEAKTFYVEKVWAGDPPDHEIEVIEMDDSDMKNEFIQLPRKDGIRIVSYEKFLAKQLRSGQSVPFWFAGSE